MEIHVEVVLPDGATEGGFVDLDRSIEQVMADIIDVFRVRISSGQPTLHLLLDPGRTPRDYQLTDGDKLILAIEPEPRAFRPGKS